MAYQLVVPADDAHHGVTEVLRGDDLLDSTPRQAYLLQLLGLTRPAWAHVPLVVDEQGERLAKRHDALSLRALREAGVPPESLVAWMGRAMGQKCGQRARQEELLPAHDLGRLPRSPLPFTAATFQALKEPN